MSSGHASKYAKRTYSLMMPTSSGFMQQACMSLSDSMGLTVPSIATLSRIMLPS